MILECAFFYPEKIIGKAIKYNLNSDAAHKFERSVDVCCHEDGAQEGLLKLLINMH